MNCIIVINVFTLQPPQIITMNGSVRIKSCDLELPQSYAAQVSMQPLAPIPQPVLAAVTSASGSTVSQTIQQSQQPQTTQHLHGNTVDADTGRAVDNQYSFV